MKEGWQRLRFVIASIVGGKEAKGKLLDLPVPFSLKLAYEEKTKEGAKLLEEKAERHLSSDTSSLPAQVAIIKLFSHRLSGHCPNPGNDTHLNLPRGGSGLQEGFSGFNLLFSS